MNKTKFDDDAFASGQAVLAQFKLSGKQIENLTPLLADYAAKTGKDLPTAAETLGKSFLGNTRADPCSRVLKRELCDRWIKERFGPLSPEGCVLVFGIGLFEKERYDE